MAKNFDYDKKETLRSIGNESEFEMTAQARRIVLDAYYHINRMEDLLREYQNVLRDVLS